MPIHTTLGSLFSDIADAIRAKTGENGTIVADNFPTAIESISEAKGNAAISEVLAGKTFSNASSNELTGTMVNNGAVSGTIITNAGTFTVPAGYTSGGTITANIPVYDGSFLTQLAVYYFGDSSTTGTASPGDEVALGFGAWVPSTHNHAGCGEVPFASSPQFIITSTAAEGAISFSSYTAEDHALNIQVSSSCVAGTYTLQVEDAVGRQSWSLTLTVQ